jgi:tetratricopeptide (TPR) repeat protein
VPDERVALAERLYAEREFEHARPLLLELRAEQPDDARIAVLTAWTHDSLGLEEEAAEHYEAALANGLAGDDLRGALLGLGSTYRTLGRDDDAERIFLRGLHEFPDFRPYRVFRAMLQYNRGEAREALRELIDVLLETTSDPAIQRYRRALMGYADDLDRSWLDGRAASG